MKNDKKHLIYSFISLLCFPTVIVIQHFVQDKTTATGLVGLVIGICLTCLIHSFIIRGE